MAYVKEIKPSIIVLEFRQEPGDPDYGSCLWAEFVLDLDAYSLSVLSDCGNYGYSWVPTPNSESFLQLMARVEPDYLLDKISYRTVIDTEAAFTAFQKLIDENGVDPYEPDACGGPVIDLDKLQTVCGMDLDRDIVDGAKELFRGTPMEDVDEYDLWCCISRDFPLTAKKIAEVFENYIAPKCRELAASDGVQKES